MQVLARAATGGLRVLELAQPEEPRAQGVGWNRCRRRRFRCWRGRRGRSRIWLASNNSLLDFTAEPVRLFLDALKVLSAFRNEVAAEIT